MKGCCYIKIFFLQILLEADLSSCELMPISFLFKIYGEGALLELDLAFIAWIGLSLVCSFGWN